MIRNLRILFFSMNKKKNCDDGGRFHENVESLCLNRLWKTVQIEFPI